ncbi:ATP-dependent Clp protease adaptor protein ClpS [uncultured Candidatus Thioglobus sp.]|nr:ATP-dependent Clp protease adaptor protein ClpS [uncultured Candidatus Thioglobus sp.]
MNFVVYVLESFFAMAPEVAQRIMLEIHNKGEGICGVFSKQIAETKVTCVNDFSKENQHPLICTMQKE